MIINTSTRQSAEFTMNNYVSVTNLLFIGILETLQRKKLISLKTIYGFKP
jgi:hypothetical protein